MLQQIKATALSKGYWSIWMTVFQNVPAMLQHLNYEQFDRTR